MYNLIHGNALQELQKLKEQGQEFDMVLTDPPYSSGGRTFSERRQDPTNKYSQAHDGKTEQEKSQATFAGDNLDQRVWTRFTEEWMTLARKVTKPSGLILSFIDWRQLPAMTDAVQMAGVDMERGCRMVQRKRTPNK
jgi:site-specific DNA-methyltransferase (adenine-specific)